jgi:hypothetical protein
MQHTDPVSAPHSVALTSASGNPAEVGFEVGIDAAEPESPSRFFTVAGPDPAASARGTRKYRLPDTGHHAYLNFLRRLPRTSGPVFHRTASPQRRPHPRRPSDPCSPRLCRQISFTATAIRP